MRNLAKTAFVLALSTAALPAVTAPASALVVASAIGTNFFPFTAPEALVPINFNGTVARTTLPFTLPAAAKVAITFSAECAAAGDADSFIDIDIQVDGVAVPGTQSHTDLFCGHNGGTLDVDGFTHPSVTAVKSLSAGPHIVTVLGRLDAGATAGRLSDSVTVVER
jgi:hypothetical protein